MPLSPLASVVTRRSHEGHRCTLSDASGPVVSVWAPTRREAFQEAHAAEARRSRNPHRRVLSRGRLH